MKNHLKVLLFLSTLMCSSLVPAMAGNDGLAGVAGMAATAVGVTKVFKKKKDDDCTKYKFSNSRKFKYCTELSELKSFLHWNYEKPKLEIAFRADGADSSNWVAWGINPTGKGMDGVQAIVGYKDDKGSIKAYTAPVVDKKTKLEEGKLSFPTSDVSGEITKEGIILYATLTLGEKNSTIIRHVWQKGPMTGKDIGPHPTSGDNLKSMAEVDLEDKKYKKGKKNGTNRLSEVPVTLYALSWGLLSLILALY